MRITRSLPSPAGVSCEFANTGVTKLLILNMGPSTPAAFAILRSKTSGGGRTITQVSGLGSEAFSVSKNGKPGGESALTTGGVIISIVSNIPFAKDTAVIQQLMARY